MAWGDGLPAAAARQAILYWKGAVRRAMDNLRIEIDDLYRNEVGRLNGVNPRRLRDDYIKVVLGNTARERFLQEEEIDLPADAAERLLKLVEAQYYRQRMYSSCTYFFPLLDLHTTRYGIANAAHSIRLIREATGVDLAANYRHDLSIASGQEIDTGNPIYGDQIFDEFNNVFTSSAGGR